MVLVVGDISIDITAPLAADPAVGEDCLSPQLTLQCGGVGLNAAVVMQRLGAPARLVGCVGEDWFGRFAQEFAASEGIDTRFIQRSGAAMTGLFLIAISPDGQRTFFGSRGASAQLRMTDELRRTVEDDGLSAVQIAGYALLSASSRECARQLIRRARERGLWTALDLGLGPSRQIPGTLMQMLGEVETVFANRDEAEALVGESNAEAALIALEQAGARQVVLKLGAEGALIRSRGKVCRVPAFAVKVVDTTGAGDAFTAGFAAGRTWNWTTEECALLANACGAAASSTMGAGQNLPDRSRIEQLLLAARLEEWETTRAQVAERLKARLDAIAITRVGGA